jgi:hypothetical protein
MYAIYKYEYKDMENTNDITEDMWVVVEDLTEEQAAKREQEREEKWRQKREDAKLLANFLGWKYYPKVDGEQKPGWWSKSVRNAYENPEGEMAFTMFPINPKPICRNANELRSRLDNWDIVMSLAKKIDEEDGVKIELSYNKDEVYKNVVEYLKSK